MNSLPREDPLDRDANIGILHAGCLGASLAVALGKAGYRVHMVHRSNLSAAAAVADRIVDAGATSNAQVLVDGCDVVFVTCTDQRLSEVVEVLQFRSDHVVLHCSGATPVSVLDEACAYTARTGGIHPLQLFPDALGYDRFGGVTFSVDAADSNVRTWLVEVAEALGGRAIPITESERALYHASATMVSPLFTGLVGMAADLWPKLGRSREEALEALGPLLRSTAEQIEEMGIPGAITGPLSRGDVETTRQHLQELGTIDPDVVRVYASLALAQLSLVADGRDFSEPDRLRMEDLLRAAVRS